MNEWRKFRAKAFNKMTLPDDQERITKALLGLAIAFVVLQIPGTIYPIFRLIINIPTYQCEHFYLYFYTIADLLVVISSAINFFIFLLIPPYRKVLMQFFRTPTKDYRRGSVETQISIVSGRDERARTLSTQI